MAESESKESLSRLRLPWESDDQWDLRVHFLHKHWGLESEDRLLALSQIFLNVEFLGCKYEDNLMRTVAELSAGISDQYRQTRQQAVNQVFGDGETGGMFDRHQPEEPPTKRGTGGKAGNLGSKTINETSGDKRRKEKQQEVYNASQGASSQGVSSNNSKMTQLLQKMAAAYSIANKDLGPLEQFNRLCAGAGTEWELVVAQSTPAVIAHCMIGNTLLAQVMSTSKMAAKLDVCQVALTILQKRHLEIRDFSVNGQSLPAVFSTDDRRNSWSAPDAQMFVPVEKKLTGLAHLLNRAQNTDTAVKRVDSGCRSLGIRLDVQSRQLSGWTQATCLALDGVQIYEHVCKGGASAKQAEAYEQLHNLAIDMLRKAHLKVYESNDAHSPYKLLASDQPISEQLLQETITKGQSVSEQRVQSANELHEQLRLKVVLIRRMYQNVAASQVLNQSFTLSHVNYQFTEQFENGIAVSSLSIGDLGEVCAGEGTSKQLAKDAASRQAVQYLSEHCYTILAKCVIDNTKEAVGLDSIMNDMKSEAAQTSSGQTPSVAQKLMAKMGWSGAGGLGKNNQGISEPIKVHDVMRRQGLGSLGGMSQPRQFQAAVQSVLHEYASGKQQQELVFSEELSKEQRKVIHRLCNRFGLKTKSYGTDNRQLTVKRRQTAHELVLALLEVGGQTGRYTVCAPGTHNWNDITQPPQQPT